MLGGGTFVTQNKVLPGAYINVVSTKSASAILSDRGIVTMPLELDWGVAGEIFEVSASNFLKNSLKIFGYSYNHEKMKGLRDLFKNTSTLYAYRLNGGGAKASNTYATAKFTGVRGNDIKIVIQENVDDPNYFDVKTVIDDIVVDLQTVGSMTELVENDFVVFESTAIIASTPGLALSGGTNEAYETQSHQTYLDLIESYSFNTMGVVAVQEEIKSLYVNFCKRMRDEIGAKFQVVLYNKAADYEGVINVKNSVDLVYWVTGVEAGCAINKSTTNKKYDGEFVVNVDYTQSQLEMAIESGEFTLHKVGTEIRVLEDINSLVTVTAEKGDVFKDNQTIRVVDQISNDIAVLFNTKYLGSIPNNASGRISFWTDVVKHHEQMQNIRAIEDFSDKDVTVEAGEGKNSIVVNDAIKTISAMTKLYMTTMVQ